ncbi:MAG: DegV family protein [Lachnospiraceae bacterium]|jgi:DegV family protein with EDD domain|nr:DegV family protein [Lachnospiraceae bacterium]
MNYKIIGDSCCDLTAEYKKDSRFDLVPLTLQVDDTYIRDDETFDQAHFLKLVRESKSVQKSACPSPEDFMASYAGEEEMVFVVTLSQHLSGTYNSAVLAKNLYYEENPNSTKKIHIFSSDSACCGESLIAFRIRDLAESGASFEEIVEQAGSFRDGMKTYFVLETLDFLRKNGRLTGLASILASALNIKPVMSADHGVIIKLNQARGITKALGKMCDLAVEETLRRGVDTKKHTLGITHCNCPDRAEAVREQLCSRLAFRDVYITPAAGVSSLYAGDGGVVVAI